MVKGVNAIGESSSYLFNGKGALVEQTWHIAKNGYGYHDVDAGTEEESGGKSGSGSGGKGHGNGNGQGNGNGSGDKPTGSEVGTFSTVVKQFVIDYTRETMDPLMEHEVNGLDYRYVYGNERLSVNISPITEGAGHIVESGTVGQQVRLYYHQDLRGTVDYLTSPVSRKVESWTHYNEWGEITHNAVLKMGQRELDLVKNYTGHDFDAVLNLYYAKARMYDAENRRFVSIDPILDGTKYDLSEYTTEAINFTSYLYVRDNPLRWIDSLGLYLDGMTIMENARGKNVTEFILALYDWEESQLNDSTSKFRSPKLYRNEDLIFKLKAKYSAVRNESDPKKVIEYAVNDMGLQSNFLVALMNYNAYLVRNGSEKTVQNLKIIDSTTWNSLDLKVNETLQEEYGFNRTLYGDNISFSVIGNTININYYPKLFVCGTVSRELQFDGNNRYMGNKYVLSDEATWNKYADWIRAGLEEMFDNTTPIFGITPTINVSFNPEVAFTKWEADYRVNVGPGRSQVAGWTSHNNSGVLDHYTNYWEGSKYEYDEVSFRRTSTHEFGHVLGLGDAYAEGSRPVDNENIFPNSLMKYQWDGYIVSGNDIEMILLSWKNNTKEKYTKGVDGSQAFYYGYEAP